MSNPSLFSCFILLFALACQTVAPPHPYGLIDPMQAKEVLEVADVTVIDVRTPKEVAAGKIDGATNYNIFDDDFNAKIEKLDTSGTYLVYCRRGSRSANAAKIMRSFGFTKVYDLEGGFENWISKE